MRVCDRCKKEVADLSRNLTFYIGNNLETSKLTMETFDLCYWCKSRIYEAIRDYILPSETKRLMQELTPKEKEWIEKQKLSVEKQKAKEEAKRAKQKEFLEK